MWTPPGFTKEGYELQFGTNHVGHALLTKLLTPTLLRTAERPSADVRVVVLSSAANETHPVGGLQFDKLKSACEDMPVFRRYSQSKLANVLFARELARHYPQLTVSSVHPGAVSTNLGGPLAERFPWLQIINPIANLVLASPEKGVRNQLWASVSKDVVSGELYYPVGIPGRGAVLARDDDLARRLWEWTEKELQDESPS